MGDRTHTGLFNSRLISPSYDVPGASTALLTFNSHYLKCGSETASVLVSFDSATLVKLLTYTTDTIAKQEHLTIPVPAGAHTAKLTWFLTNGNNDWYWSVDNPRFTKN